VSQHTVHLAYESLRSDIRTVESWKIVSTWSIAISSTVSLLIGLFVYMTFWEHAQSDLFELYPPIAAIDISKLLLCVTMLLTFPLPFFTCRDMIVLCLEGVAEASRSSRSANAAENCTTTDGSAAEQLQEPLLEEHEDDDRSFHTASSHQPGPSNSFTWLLPDQGGDGRQLKLPYHIAITFVLWITTTFLAIVSPSLGDVLDLVGCATGTVIAFVLPSLFSFRLVGYSHTAAIVFLVGGFVGSLGTYESIGKLIADV
jgi:amino acid permease